VIIQLQYLEPDTGKNGGGLYVDSDFIGSLQSSLRTIGNVGSRYTIMCTKDGKEYVLATPFSEVLDQWNMSKGNSKVIL
jgi:hypothetical protein